MIPLWFSIETPLTPAQVCERIKEITHPAPTSFWRQLRLDWARTTFHGKLFAGTVSIRYGTFRIFNYLWGIGDKKFTVYNGRVESSKGKTIVQVTLIPSSMFMVWIGFVPLVFVILSAFHPEKIKELPGDLLFVAAIFVPLFSIFQCFDRYKARKLFLQILTTSPSPVNSRRSGK